ncbi:MAG TPA: Asp-tRNA(Asn)/Glu-tRNA(Gln) amidotransferase subunit GatB [Candidatus Thermoplasmatota archaeon]|nr:Asp-tRNA(Asn)/Glu-tRNA(Gln) amidotransferase subunit GatB [Candidatus Thermoplasmatota archaeon]
MTRVMIGLEVHVYLRTQSKLFCACSADFLASRAANTQVCHVCTGQPGAKPLAPNAAALVAAVRLARALGMELASSTQFLRKHYFYPDLPSNYQRTSEPIATGGTLAGCALTELHVEEDPGAYDPATGLVDYDRSGAPLIELVTEPEIASPAHARRLLQELRLALSYLGIGRDEAGIKADCNLSIDGGARVEVKNVNSVRNVERALQHELERQQREGAVRETRHFDEQTGRTTPLRAKETAADYRFLADPDLRPVDLHAVATATAREEGVFARRARVAALAGVAEEDASALLEERALADLFERLPTRTAFHFLVRDVRGELDFRKASLAASGVSPGDIAALLAAREEARITPQVATRLLRHALDHRGLGDELAKELGATTDASDVDAAARAAVAANPRAVADWRAGKTSAIQFLVGQTMRQLKGRGDAAVVRAAVERALQG